MVVIVMLMMIKQWSEFALHRLVGGSWGGPGQELHTAPEPRAGCWGLVACTPITPRLNSSLAPLTITLTLTICDTDPRNSLRSTSHL